MYYAAGVYAQPYYHAIDVACVSELASVSIHDGDVLETHSELCQRLSASLAALSIYGHEYRPLMGLADGGSAALLCRRRWHIPSMHHAAPQKCSDGLQGVTKRTVMNTP